jgi:glycosyltransferase involved in cell wall biosynthesis
MRILFYNHTGQVSGAERMLLMILARLDRRRFESVVICPAPGPLTGMMTTLGVPVQEVTSLAARFTWRLDHLLRYLRSFVLLIRQLRQKARCLKPDLIHANSIRAGLVATAATLGLNTRVVWHLHDLLPRHPLSTGVRLFACLRADNRMIAVSRAVAENFEGTIPGLRRSLRKRTTVILNAIELEGFQPNEKARQHVRAELNCSDVDLLVGIVGQITPRKGQLELLRAFSQVVRTNPSASLVMIGAPIFNNDHKYEQLLIETAQSLGVSGHVRMLGARNDVQALMQALDLVVVNSSKEPFGLVALEAMASGTAVLAAACDGLKEIIEHNVDGWLAPAGDEAELVAAINKLLGERELRQRLATAGKTKVANAFPMNRYLAELEMFYEGSGEGQSRIKPSASTLNPTEATSFAEFAEQ